MTDNFKLTPHFSFYEATDSRQFPELVKANRDAALYQLPRILLVAGLLEEIRFLLGKPIEVHSWFRGPALNKAAGGHPESQHQKGEAVDWSPLGPDTYSSIEEAHRVSIQALAMKMFGQLIAEHGPAHSRKHWIHLSLGFPLRDLSDSRELLRFEAGLWTNRGRLDSRAWRMV